MSDAFEQWAADKSFMLRVSAGDGYVNVKEMALEAWQAALQSGEPVAVADRGVLNWIDGKQFAREADLYTTPQPVVDEAVFDILKAAQGSCRLGFNDIADKQIEIAIKALLSAGKETV